MYRNMVLSLAIGIGLLPSQRAATPAPESPWVAVTDGAGHNKGGFVPDLVPLKNPLDARPRSVFFVNDPKAKTADGQVISGFAVEGWREAGAIRVVIYAMVPRPGLPNQNLGGQVDKLKKRQLASVSLKIGETRKIIEMQPVGVDPMEIRIDPKMPPNMLHR